MSRRRRPFDGGLHRSASRIRFYPPVALIKKLWFRVEVFYCRVCSVAIWDRRAGLQDVQPRAGADGQSAHFHSPNSQSRTADERLLFRRT